MRLLLIRHAQIPSNVSGTLDTAEPGPSLTELGRRQAAALARTLENEALEHAWVSTLVRTRQTIEPTSAERDLAVTVLDGLREIRAGAYEGRNDRASQQGYMRTVFAWASGEPDVRMPGGESGHEFVARFDASLAEVAASGIDDAVVVSHGAAIRCWTAIRVAGADREHLAANPFPNTGIVPLEGGPGSWRMRAWRGVPAGAPHHPASAGDDPTGAAQTSLEPQSAAREASTPPETR